MIRLGGRGVFTVSLAWRGIDAEIFSRLKAALIMLCQFHFL